MNRFEMYWQHLKAWWRGDVVAITSVFQKAIGQLDAHGKYLNLIADNQAQAARSLAASSKRLYDAAAEASNIKANLTKVVG
jgi:ABC-type transporter Mla subunit MlaD